MTTPRRRAEARIIAPVRARLRRAGVLSVLSGALWPVQAAAIAWAVAGWAATGGANAAGAWPGTLWAALVFVACGAARAALDQRAGAILFAAADATIARERAALITREARAPARDGGAASLAALAVQKLPLLGPWITRYHIAMMRVAVLPPLILALAFWQSWLVGLTLLVAGPLIPLFMALVGMAAEDASRRHLAEIGTLNDMLAERLAALADIRLLGAFDRASADFAARADDLRVRTMAVLRIAFLSSTVLELFAALGVAMVAVFVGFTLLGQIGIGAWGGLTLAQGLFLLLLAPEFFQPLRDLSAAWHDRAAGLAVVAELDALDRADRVAILGTGAAQAPLAGPFALRLRGAVAALPGAAVALPDLTLGPGQAVALTGPSGAGKTTALHAIAGLVGLAQGQITVCGQPLGDANADAWRARLALMPQRVQFGDAPLARWLDPRDSGADPWPALRLAQADAIVARLPQGLATHLGQAGGGVSGGEARRLMLARAIMAGGDLLLADEPTADLDPATAARIIATLRQLHAQGRALIVATHDPALIAAMDHSIEVTA